MSKKRINCGLNARLHNVQSRNGTEMTKKRKGSVHFSRAPISSAKDHKRLRFRHYISDKRLLFPRKNYRYSFTVYSFRSIVNKP